MKIKIGDCEIASDETNWIVRIYGEKINKITKEKSYGLKKERYPATFLQACEFILFNATLKQAEAKNLKEVIETIKSEGKKLREVIEKKRIRRRK